MLYFIVLLSSEALKGAVFFVSSVAAEMVSSREYFQHKQRKNLTKDERSKRLILNFFTVANLPYQLS